MKGSMPEPRLALRDSALSRPDWTQSTARDPRLLWLDKNEGNDPELAAIVSDVMASLPATAYSTYPDCAPLYRKLASKLGVAPENLILTAGADGAIRSVFEAYVSPDDTVIHTVPTFAMYSVYTRMFGARSAGLAYTPSNAGPILHAETVVTAIKSHRPKLVCLPNPDSPTGTVFSPPDLETIISAAAESGALILIDEAYYPFYDHTVITWIERYPQLVVARSTGKAWGSAGLRIGYAVGSRNVIAMLHKVRPMYEVNSVAVAALERLLDREDAMLASVARLNQGKAIFLAAMRDLGFQTLQGHGNFAHVAFGSRAPAVHRALSSVAYYRRDFTEPSLVGFSRFSSTTPALFERVIDAIRAAVKASA